MAQARHARNTAGTQSYANFVSSQVEQDFGAGNIAVGYVQSITQGTICSQFHKLR